MKRKGNLYEQIFFTEALSRNLEVFTPLGDYLPQDCLVMNQAGKVFKIDVLAAYIEDITSWYIIPCLEVNQALRISLYGHNPNSKAKHEKYKEAWDLFKNT